MSIDGSSGAIGGIAGFVTEGCGAIVRGDGCLMVEMMGWVIAVVW